MSGMSQSNCCCGSTLNPCADCSKLAQICCLQVEHSAWTIDAPILYRNPAAPWVDGDPCPSGGLSTNICGLMSTSWQEDARRLGGIWTHSCLPWIFLSWQPDGSCTNIKLCLTIKPNMPGLGTTEYTTCIHENQYWHTRDIEFNDPVYPALNAIDSDKYPLPVPTIKIRVCPSDFVAFPDADREVFITTTVQYRQESDGPWTTDIPLSGSGKAKICTKWHGNTVCGGVMCPRGGEGVSTRWWYDLYRDKIVLAGCDGRVDDSITAVCAGPIEIDYDGGNWDTSGLPVSAYANNRGALNVVYSLRFSKSTNCEKTSCGSTTTDPPPPDPPDECDPLCWPSCVLCPTVKSMSVVVEQNPTCCFHGSFGLTYDSGTNTFYLPSPVGYTPASCGGIRTFVMSCASSSTVTFTWTYRDEDGNDHSRTDTVSASCGIAGFETAVVDVLSTLFSPALCNRGFGRGASVRVVGI